jgi:hypothetical protein
VAAYVAAGYSVCVIPKVSVQERVAFVLGQMAGMKRSAIKTAGPRNP